MLVGLLTFSTESSYHKQLASFGSFGCDGQFTPNKEIDMNKFKALDAQKKIIVITLVVVFLMLLVPPYHLTDVAGRVHNMGYALIFDAPRSGLGYYGSVNIGLLFAQWAGTLIVGGLAYFMTKE